MTPFSVFMFWLGACWLIWHLTHAPLQPDQPCDDLADVDLEERARQIELREASWLDRPVVNLKLARRWIR